MQNWDVFKRWLGLRDTRQAIAGVVITHRPEKQEEEEFLESGEGG